MSRRERPNDVSKVVDVPIVDGGDARSEAMVTTTPRLKLCRGRSEEAREPCGSGEESIEESEHAASTVRAERMRGEECWGARA